MWYTSSCPHCGRVVKEGHGIPKKRIDSPFRKCVTCHHTYIDNNKYEWAVLDRTYKFLYIFFSNNRWFPYFLFLIILAGGYWLAALIATVLWPISCFIYVKRSDKYSFQESVERCLEPGYVDSLLLHIEHDRLDIPQCEKYKHEIEKKLAQQAQLEREREEAERQKLLREYHQHCKKCGKKLNALQIVCDNCGERRV